MEVLKHTSPTTVFSAPNATPLKVLLLSSTKVAEGETGPFDF
jgi:hypothetical protein